MMNHCMVKENQVHYDDDWPHFCIIVLHDDCIFLLFFVI